MNRIIKAAAAAAGLFCTVAPASAAVFNFTGTCAEWVCTGGATATLTLGDSYVVGNDFTAADFVSLDYTSDSGVSFTLTADGLTNVWGGFSTFTFFPGAYNVWFKGVATNGETHDLYTYNGDGTGWNSDNRDEGFSFQWVGEGLGIDLPPEEPTDDVPEPASWAMMLAGFGLVGSAMRRRRTVVSFG